ncbi:MAG: hypothetical protein U0229_22020 [Anaeromyxobacter sp.]
MPYRIGSILVALAFVWPALAAPKKKIAVAEVRVIQDVKEGTAKILTEIVTTELAVVKELRVISSAEVGALIGFENEKRLLGCTSEDQACIAEVGGALGVEYVLLAQVGVIGKLFRFSVILVDTKQAVVTARAAVFSDTEAELVGAAQFAARSVLFQLGLGPQPVLPTRAPDGAGLVPPPPVAQAPEVARPPGAARAPSGPTALGEAKPDGRPATSKAPPRVIPLPVRQEPVGPKLLIGAGVLAIAGGTVLAVLTNREYEEIKAQRSKLTPSEYDSYYPGQADRVRRLALGSDLALGAGLAATVGGIVWSSVGGRSPRPGLTLAPSVSPAFAGAFLSARW